MKLYTVLIMDVVDSRKYKNERLRLQNIIKSSISYLNKVFKRFIIKDVLISSGDEMQGLFKSNYAAYLYFRKLQVILSPVKIRCGIGRGTVEYLVDSWNSSETDGAAYHYARDALNYIQAKDKHFMCYKSGLGMDFNINTLFNSLELLNGGKKNYIIEELIEILNPIVLSEEMYALSNLDELLTILKEKSVLCTLLNLVKNENENRINYNKILHSSPIDISKLRIDFKNDLFIDGFLKKGLSSAIAEILSTSRQNIDKKIISGKIREIRNLDGSIILLLKKLGE